VKRPQSGAARSKTTPVQFFVSRDERAALKAEARKRGISMSEVIRTDLPLFRKLRGLA
jgi:hypothetical protein